MDIIILYENAKFAFPNNAMQYTFAHMLNILYIIHYYLYSILKHRYIYQ